VVQVPGSFVQASLKFDVVSGPGGFRKFHFRVVQSSFSSKLFKLLVVSVTGSSR